MTWALAGAVCIGLTLGLLGSGGAILTVPILVYLVEHLEKAAITESLAIVAAIATFEALRGWSARRLEGRAVLAVGLPGMVGTALGAWLARWVPGEAQIALLALVMLGAAALMLRPVVAVASPGEALPADDLALGEAAGEVDARPRSRPLAGPLAPLLAPPAARAPASLGRLALVGLAVGAVTGLVGVGGGFLIVPALVLLGRLPIGRAVPTSLAIIALNASTGFVRYLGELEAIGQRVDWAVIGAFAVVGVLGSTAGGWIGRRMDPGRLRKAFGWFLIVAAAYMLWRQVPLLTAAPGP